MKINYLLPILCLSIGASPAFSQTDEHSLPPAAFSVTDPGLAHWEAYFEKHYFSKGIPADSLGEGSGYLPFRREKRLYDLRKDHRGDGGGLKRREAFLKIRSRTLNRFGPTPAADWQSLGPNKMQEMGGRMIAHAFDPQNSQVLWAGSASGGLWLSENGGDSWQPMSDQIPSAGIGAIAINPLDGNTLLIGTGEGYALGSVSIRPGLGVFKSTDRGLTWQPTEFDYLQSAGVSAFKLIWSYADTNIVWLAATNGIWKSMDAGQSWVLKKGDGTNQQTSICDDLIQHPTNPDLLYAAIESDGVWRSVDGGDNWLKLSGGLPVSGMNFISIDLCRSQPEVIYASIANDQAGGFNLKGLYRSNNGGDSWTKILQAPDAFCPPGSEFGCQGWYDNVVAVSPENPDVVWLGGASLWRSTTGGQNWTQHDYYGCPGCPLPIPCRTYVDQHDFAFDPENSQTVYAFNDGGVFKSTDSGDCWAPKNENLITAQFYAIASGRSDPGTVIAGTQDHGLQGIKLSENTNLGWDRWGFLDGSDVEVHGTLANILYGGWIDGKYWRTTGGVHALATQITNGINLAENGGFYWAVLRKHPQNHAVLLGATKQKIYKTTNGGTSWVPVVSVNEPRVFEFDQNDPNFAYAAAWSLDGSRSFWRSENGGNNWFQTNNPGWRVTDIKSSPLQAGLVYVSRNSNLPNVAHIYKSDNFGNSWTPIQGDLLDLPVNAIAVHPFVPGVLFAATDLGVFITCNDGQTWTEYNENLPVTFIMDIEFNPADTTLRVGTLGRGAWLTKAWMPEETTPATEPIESGRFSLTSVFPNPAEGAVQIVFFLEKPAAARLEIVNVLGQNVATLFSEKRLSGEHRVSWNGLMSNGLRANPGTYFVRLTAGREAVIQQLIMK